MARLPWGKITRALQYVVFAVPEDPYWIQSVEGESTPESRLSEALHGETLANRDIRVIA